MPLDVSTPVFEGPFDLLLHLILRDEVDLYEVTLVDIVDAYLAELDRMAVLELGSATEFLLIAATLVELKARRLLPDDGDLDLDVELALWEERDLLLARLLEFKTFKDAASALDQRFERTQRCVAHYVGPDDRFVDLQPDLLAGVGPLDLRAAFIRAMTPKPVERVNIDHLPSVRVSVLEALGEVVDELRRARRLSFRDLCDGLADRLEIVVRFLAVLELFKRGLVDVYQGGNFGALDIRWTGDDEAADAVLVGVDVYDG